MRGNLLTDPAGAKALVRPLSSTSRSSTLGPGYILQLVRQQPGISRSDIGRITGLALSTVSLRIESLLNAGYVMESGFNESRGGRRSVGLSVDPGLGAIGLMVVSPEGLEVAVADATGRILATRAAADLELGKPDATLTALWRRLERLARTESPKVPLRTLCVSVAGPVEYPSGIVMQPAALPGWHDAPVRLLLEELTGLPTVVENRAHLGALAGAAEFAGDADPFLGVMIGDYIGSGLVMDGRLHRGASGGAGEIGHVRTTERSVIECTCTTTDCLESVAGGRALRERLGAIGIATERIDDVVRLGGGDEVRAIEVLRAAGRTIGSVLAGMVNMIDPAIVVLYGPLAQCVPLVRALRAEVYEQSLALSTSQLTVTAVQPDPPYLRGAVIAAVDHLLDPRRVDAAVAAVEA